MALQVYPPVAIVGNILNHFFRYAGLKRVSRTASDAPELTRDKIISDMEQLAFIRIDAQRDAPRGKRDRVVFLVLAEDDKYTNHSPELRKLLESIEAERFAEEGRLDEIIVVAEDSFFGKKNMTEVIRERIVKHQAGADPEGVAPFYSAYRYRNFAAAIPECSAVARHRVMAPAEVAELLEYERIARSDIGVAYTTDPPIIWCGGREGQVVEITRDSPSAGKAITYRRIERGQI